MRSERDRFRIPPILAASLALVGFAGCSLVGPLDDEPDSASLFPPEEGLFGEPSASGEARTALAAAKVEAGSERARTLEGYFQKGDYAQAVEMAEDLRALAEAGSEDADVAGFILGVSLFHLGRHEESERILAAHAESFPQSRHEESARFYRGSNLVRLRQWRSAAGVLDAFLAAYPESILIEFALIDRAECHLALGEPDRALERCDSIERQFVYSKIRDRAMNMKGGILEKKGETKRAGEAYAAAAEIARKLDHTRALTTSLAGLIRVSAAEGNYKASSGYYATFFDNFSGSPEAAEAALAGLPALREKGQLEAGLRTLEKEILALRADTPAGEMRKVLRGYASFYGEANGPEKLLRRFDDLSGQTGKAKRLHEQIIVARLEVLESSFPEYTAEIRVFYEEMRAHFNREDLSSETLVKLGRHVSLSDLAEAEEILEAALERDEGRSRDLATLELAKVRAAMPDADKQHLATVGFRKVLDVYGQPELAEDATLGLARLYARREDWTNARAFWSAYARHSEWTKAREEALKQLALAESNAGPAPEPAPEAAVAVAVAPTRPLPAKGVFERGHFRASALVETGNRRGAYETLTALIDRIEDEDVKDLKGNEKRAYRRAVLLQQQLGVELGLSSAELE